MSPVFKEGSNVGHVKKALVAKKDKRPQQKYYVAPCSRQNIPEERVQEAATTQVRGSTNVRMK